MLACTPDTGPKCCPWRLKFQPARRSGARLGKIPARIFQAARREGLKLLWLALVRSGICRPTCHVCSLRFRQTRCIPALFTRSQPPVETNFWLNDPSVFFTRSCRISLANDDEEGVSSLAIRHNQSVKATPRRLRVYRRA